MANKPGFSHCWWGSWPVCNVFHPHVSLRTRKTPLWWKPSSMPSMMTTSQACSTFWARCPAMTLTSPTRSDSLLRRCQRVASQTVHLEVQVGRDPSYFSNSTLRMKPPFCGENPFCLEWFELQIRTFCIEGLLLHPCSCTLEVLSLLQMVAPSLSVHLKKKVLLILLTVSSLPVPRSGEGSGHSRQRILLTPWAFPSYSTWKTESSFLFSSSTGHLRYWLLPAVGISRCCSYSSNEAQRSMSRIRS